MAAKLVVLMLCCFVGFAHAQTAFEVGSPDAAFAGGPIRLSKSAAALLRAHYQGDKVPLVPQPFRGKLDTALLGRDFARVEVLTKQLTAARGVPTTLMWEQSRFIATGSVGVAELHAEDIAATGASAVSETAVMLWFYAAAVTMTDGHKCVDEAAKDGHLDRLRGPEFAPVIRILRGMSDDRVTAMRDLAIRLETVLAVDRTDDTMCRAGTQRPDVRPDPAWRPEAALTRAMLPRHLLALAAVMRPRPVVPGRHGAAVANIPGLRPEIDVEPIFPGSGLSLPAFLEPAAPASVPLLGEAISAPPPAPIATSAPPPADPNAGSANPPLAPAAASSAESRPAAAELVNPVAAAPDPARSEPPNPELTTPASRAAH